MFGYEINIAWRYLYRGAGDNHLRRLSLIFFVLFVVSMVVNGMSHSVIALLIAGVTGMGLLVCMLLYVLNVATAVSTFGVVLGVAVLVVVLSVTNGLSFAFREKVLGVNSHLIVQHNGGAFANHKEVASFILGSEPRVVAAHSFLLKPMLVVRGQGEMAAVSSKGIDPKSVGSVLSLEKDMVVGSVSELQSAEDEPPKIIIGKGLSERLKAKLGDTLTVMTSPSTGTKNGVDNFSPSRSRKFEVAGVFYVGFNEYDQSLVYMNRNDLQSMIEPADHNVGLEFRVSDIRLAGEIASSVDRKLREEYSAVSFRVESWDQLNNHLFQTLQVQKIALVIVLTLVIMVAAFNLVSSMTMKVVDKTQEIAILKTMGASSSSIAITFQCVGIAIGFVGTLFGLVGGLLLCLVLTHIELPLDPSVYYIDKLPVRVEFAEVAAIACIAVLLAGIATVFPSLRAAQMRPVVGLRHDD